MDVGRETCIQAEAQVASAAFLFTLKQYPVEQWWR